MMTASTLSIYCVSGTVLCTYVDWLIPHNNPMKDVLYYGPHFASETESQKGCPKLHS